MCKTSETRRCDSPKEGTEINGNKQSRSGWDWPPYHLCSGKENSGQESFTLASNMGKSFGCRMMSSDAKARR